MVTFANSVDPDEMARNEPPHQNPNCWHFVIEIWLKPLFVTVDMYSYEFIDWRVQIQRWESPFQKLKVERVKGIFCFGKVQTNLCSLIGAFA